MIELADPQSGETMADLGSGDGRILIAFGKKGIVAHGYELDPILVDKSQSDIKRENLINKAFVHKEDFWEKDLSSFDIITIYPMPDIMNTLEKKLRKELNPAARVLLNFYPFINTKPKMAKNNIYLYQFD